ncbi:sensor domain-containing protein [Microbacterium rhizomatis]|uniref:Diguanylate cyclase n=1 Tax=Microbacterium rhizomatis TaxID=1631477 RepID=A0A5J5IVG3_9MICO|nr:diguanylate cyclase [Microbacterium rhizomatis]KAA9104980.1 diguanylate cyclase [Microbacterium rhizomatis]
MNLGDYERLYLHAPCGLLTTDAAGRVVSVNDTLLDWTGHRRPALVGTDFASLLDAPDRILFETHLTRARHLERGVAEVALMVLRADGSRLPVLLSSAIVHDEASPLVHTALFDATDRMEYEDELLRARTSAESSEESVRVLQEISSLFGESVSDEDVAQTFAEVARAAFDAEETAVLLRGSDGLYELVGGTNPLADSVPPIQALRDTAVEIVVHDVDAETDYPVLAAGLRAARLESLSITPLLSDSERLGVLVCFYRRRREFDDRAFELQRALGRQASQTLVRVRLQRQLEHLATHDPLTGLANRQLLQQELDDALEDARRANEPLAVIFLDVDEFKSVNDGWGHATGDGVLRSLADRLRNGVRADDMVGRIGGDEFVAICRNADLDAAVSIADRVLELTRAPVVIEDATIRVSMSAGVSTFDPAQHPLPLANDLLIRADVAMYRSKDAGKDRVTLSTG